MRYDFEIKTAPTVEPVTLQEVKDHLRVGHDEDDNLLQSLIESSRLRLEQDTGRAFVTQTRTLRLSGFPWGERRIYLPGDPVASITHVKYYDTGGTQQTWTSAEYSLRQGNPSFIQLGFDYTWPEHRSTNDEVEIEYVCGQAVTAITEDVKHCLKLRIELDYAEQHEKEYDRALRAYNVMAQRLNIGEEFETYGS